MRHQKTDTKISLAAATLLLAGPFLISSAFANPTNYRTVHQQKAMAQAHGVTKSHTVAYTPRTAGRGYGHSRVARSYGISCVPFARAESGIVLTGNAWQWWGNATGVYARGATPEAGSVLAFRANGRMRMGHVAVIARVVNVREVLIDHANWPGATLGGGVSASIPVVDVSENNDWSAVRVGRGHDGDFGSVYPTYGFIYDRPDAGTLEANRAVPAAPVLALSPAPRDLRQTPARGFVEVAEVPRQPHRQVGLIMPPSVPPAR
jgi:surface antigen